MPRPLLTTGDSPPEWAENGSRGRASPAHRIFSLRGSGDGQSSSENRHVHAPPHPRAVALSSDSSAATLRRGERPGVLGEISHSGNPIVVIRREEGLPLPADRG